MTRINLVHPSELTDQHLFAEFREIKMIPKSLARSLEAAKNRWVKESGYTSEHSLANIACQLVLDRVPAAYTLNTGHVSFFYDKAVYLRNRYAELRAELEFRNIQFNPDSLLDPDGVFETLGNAFHNGYKPTPEALAIVRQRIAEKIAMKPGWYRYIGVPLPLSIAWDARVLR